MNTSVKKTLIRIIQIPVQKLQVLLSIIIIIVIYIDL